ncbi:hypothetical protein UlMin_040880 [Ulmus minor]
MGRRSAPCARLAPSCNPPPYIVNHAPPPTLAQQGGGGSLLGGIGSTISQGMAFGTGSDVAHKAMDAFFGPQTIQHEIVASEATQPQQHPPQIALVALMHACLNSYGSDLSKCQFYMDMLTECRKNFRGMLRA